MPIFRGHQQRPGALLILNGSAHHFTITARNDMGTLSMLFNAHVFSEPDLATTSTTTLSAKAMIATIVPAEVISILGVHIGIRPDLLIAGFCGSLVSIVLLNSVPSTGNTLLHAFNTMFQRLFVALASSLTAGYLTPLILLFSNIPDALLLSAAFSVGGGAQQVLIFAIRRVSGVNLREERHDD